MGAFYIFIFLKAKKMKKFLVMALLAFPVMGFGVIVKRGDTLWHLCKKHLGNPFLWPKVGKYNKLKNPHLIFPGEKIEFPDLAKIKRGILIERGEIIDADGYVLVGKKALSVSSKIKTDEALRTEEARAEILLSSGDLITILPETYIKFEGREKESEILSINLIKGKIMLKPAKKMRVVTTSSFIDINRGEMLVDCSELVRVSVFEGEAWVSGYGKRLLVSAGYGTIIGNKGPMDPIKLLEPPEIIIPENNSKTGNMRPTIKWKSPDGRTSLIEIARDRSFIHMAFDTLSKEDKVISGGLREGSYYLRISSIDNNGLQGKPSNVNRFIVERRLGIKYKIVPLFSNLPTRQYKNFISSYSLFCLFPEEEDNSIAKILVKIDKEPYFSYREPFRLKEGKRTITYKPIDMLNEEGKEETLSFIVDGKPPIGTLNISYPIKDGYLVKDATFTITASDTISGLSRIQVMINDSVKEYLERAEFELSSEGPYKIIYRFEDNVGNLSDEESISFVLDKTPPIVSLSSEPKMAVYNENYFLPEENNIILKASDNHSGVSKILYSIDERPFSIYKEPFRIKEEGLHIIRYKAADNAGNETGVLSRSVWIEPLMYEKYK